MKKRTYLVYFLIHVNTPYQYILKATVKNASSFDEAKEACTAAGFEPSEFGIPWANHHITTLKDAESSLLSQYRQGCGMVIDAEKELKELENIRNSEE